MLARDHNVAWRQLMGGRIDQVAWSLDEQRLLVLAGGGWTVFDTDGHRVARRCGWEFGLYGEKLSARPAMRTPCICAS